jgi:hypothetical protein
VPRSDSWVIQESVSGSTDLSRYRQGEKGEMSEDRALVGAGVTTRESVGRSMQQPTSRDRDGGGDPVAGITEHATSSNR